jgi:GNAT superfamily N-acetyltransferase
LTIRRRAHLNLVESSRQLFELDPGAEIETGEGWLLAAGRSSHPLISNAAFRIDDRLDPAELIARAREFFAARGRGFAIWARTDIEEDRELIATAERAGFKGVYEMPEMVLDHRPEPTVVAAGVELRQVASRRDADDYWQVAAAAYAGNGFPPEVFAFYEKDDGLHGDNVAAFLAHLDGKPAGIAMTIVSHDLAGIYWVGCTEEARRRGLGRTMTATAVSAGLDIGATSASLQASPMGEGLYRQMGFETLFNYRLLLHTPPAEKADPRS